MSQNRIFHLFFFLFFVIQGSFCIAQPANDECSNAIVIPISSGGFGLGTFSSPNIDISLATIVFGEPFYSSLITAGNDKKSVWFKYTLATSRGVKVELKQPGTAIAQSDAGFTVYKSSVCMPTLADIIPAKLTPLNKFGSSYNPCLSSGDYYVQVSSKVAANGPIFIEVTTSNPGVLNTYDFKNTRYNFGTANLGWNQITYDVGCQTIDNALEVCPALGANYTEYGQTTWMTFTTDAHIDYLRLEMGEMYNTGNYKVGYNIYQGDCFSNPSGLTLVDGCNVLQQTWFYNPDPRESWPGKNYTCFFLPNTTYSIQIFYNNSYANTVGARIYELGGAATDAPIPSALGSAPGNTNALGVLPSSPSGITTNGNDWLACNSKIINNACGSVNPVSGIITSGGIDYKLNTWYTFTISTSSNINISTPSNILKRLYTGNVFGNCNLASFTDFTTSSYDINCMAPGTYSIQMLGKIDTTNRNALDYNLNQLGKQANISINVKTQRPNNYFSLTDVSLALAQPRVYKFNGFANLANGVTYNSSPDTLGCLNTLMPSGTYCGANTKAVYRELKIGSNGILTLGGGNYYFQYRLYRGDAQSLANGQNVFASNQTITGLADMAGCQDLYWSYPKVCVTPGTYTLVSFGDQADVGYFDSPWVKFDLCTTTFFNPSAPNNMGNITGSFPATGTIDYWSCIDNPLTIDGQAPCNSSTKQIYREFYIATPQYLNISTTSGCFRLFTGQVSVGGIASLSSNIPGYGNLGCLTSFSADINTCNPRIFPAGWYTVVCYGSGGVYAGPNYINGNIGQSNNITISISAPAVIPSPLYNRPYKAYVANGGLPIVWGPNYGTAAIPQTSKTYTFGTEHFNCVNDLPFNVHPVTSCNATDNRVAYYVFTLSQESYVNFSGIPNSMSSKIFELNVRTSDSLLMPTSIPIQTCINATWLNWDNWGWNGDIEICRMQPGTYTLVVFANDADINTTLTPVAYVDKVESSRFDHANKAYDFDNVPGDNLFHFGKVGDVNPLNALRNPSDDFFTCTTGAQPNDPSNFCWDGAYQNGATNPTVPYPMPINKAHYTNTTSPPIRRDLWYTFSVTGPGRVYVNVNNKTPGKTTQYPFSIYKSNVNGSIPFATVVSTGQVDSTFLQGLTLVTTTSANNNTGNSNYSWWGCSSNSSTIDFFRDQCSGMVTDRYYVIVDHHSHLELNNEVDVGIKFESWPIIPTVYDHYSQANLINGLGQAAPPYTNITLSNGNYSGASGNFACATKDIPDQNSCGTKTLWYKIVLGATGKIRINATITAGLSTNTNFNSNDVQLYHSIIPGDSTIAGLVPISLSSITSGGLPWGEACMNPGTYYIMLTGCNYTVESVVPNVQLIQESGDFCSDPVLFTINNAATASATVNINCHTMTPDYGEDGSNMGCLFGPSGYKSTWYKITVNSLLKMDITFQLSENTTAFPNQIRYRVLYGTCNAMTAGPCNTDALTQFTLSCMPAGITDYYVQIVTPAGATGTVTLSATTVVSPDQACIPINPFKPTANFTVGPACDGQAVHFFNQSTLGANISYLWNFGCCAGATSTQISPVFTFPTTGTIMVYNVELVVTNNITGSQDSITIPVTIYPMPTCNITRDAPNNGATVTAGQSVNFHANATNTIVSPATSYFWNFGNGLTSTIANPVGIVFNTLGNYTVTLHITNGTCEDSCSVAFSVIPEAIFNGGNFDGANLLTIIGCIPSQVFNGGPYDGTGILLISNCPQPNVFSGGPYDGASLSIIVGCIPSQVFNGGPYDGSSVSTIVGCVPSQVFSGGVYDGSSIHNIVGCIPALVFAGGINDGSGLSTAIGCAPSQIFMGGLYDGSAYSTIVSCTTGQIFSGGINDGNCFYRIPCDPFLPINLLFFDAKCINGKVKLYWSTGSEFNNDYFTLERSLDTSNFNIIATIKGAGNSNEIIYYSYIDAEPFLQNAYYRLKQTDFDGKFEYFNMVSENCENESSEIFIYPNPNNGNFIVEGSDFGSEIMVYNILGEIVYKSEMKSKITEIALNGVVTGIYFVKINSSKGNKTIKIIINTN
ncbi:MAG: T9SS type A sorting domain-containing protein [Bacteroidetes bacterium]|nr:T9SS type A sorting domain-containing protein [Bacteroidota bacterium]